MNSVCERFLGSDRRECLDHIIILSERHQHVLAEYALSYFNTVRPHRGSASGLRYPLSASGPPSMALLRRSPCSEALIMSTAPRARTADDQRGQHTGDAVNRALYWKQAVPLV
jgi:hypothetical protein